MEDANWSHLSLKNRIEFLLHLLLVPTTTDWTSSEILCQSRTKRYPVQSRNRRRSNDVFDMERMRVFLKLLGDPHTGRTYKTIHVGGTKGKGTPSCFTFFLLEKAGYTIGTHKSHTFTRSRNEYE